MMRTKKNIETPTYSSWTHLRNRCHNSNHHAYSKYGGKGIRVCARWNKFENFLADMGERPKGTSIDRLDNDKNYCPENCRWATRKQQQMNRKNVRILTENGIDYSVADWAKKLGISQPAMWKRLKKWSFLDALFIPKYARRGRWQTGKIKLA